MFPATTTGRKKTGAGYENPEPSSPKVTCIGQVRVKSKKKKTTHHHHSNNSNVRSRSQRRTVDYSFRRVEEDGNNVLKRQSSSSYRNREIELESSQRHGHNNQKWVHIPVTICESLRSFGSDFNCFLPCKSSSCISDKEHHQKQQRREAEKHLGCGSVLARWLVAVQDDGEGGAKGGRQIELVVGGVDDDVDEKLSRRSYRKRHVMEDIDINEIERNLKEKVVSLNRRDDDEIVEGGRMSICVPPKNALLLMRCGSDPIKMAALTNRFWDPPPKEKQTQVEEEEEHDIHEIDEQQMAVSVNEEEDVEVDYKECETEQQAETSLIPDSDEHRICDLDVRETDESVSSVPELKCEDDNILCDKFVIEEMYHDVLDQELSTGEIDQAQTGAELQHIVMEAERDSGEDEVMGNPVEVIEVDNAVEEFEEAGQMVTTSPSSEQEDYVDLVLTEQSKQLVIDHGDEEQSDDDQNVSDKKQDSSALPDCLLLMMCEPKLSMEVSQETWVCTTDFIRWLPPREVNVTTTKSKKTDNGGVGGDELLLSKRVSIHYKPPTAPSQKQQKNQHFIQPRSSCSYPAPPAKHDSACEPLYNLTRCKSEPRRAVAKLAVAGTPESCFWKNRPHAPVGVGAAGMGF